MGLYSVVFLAVLAILVQTETARADTCNRRSTIIKVKIPRRINVTIKYPYQTKSVQFVPFPFNDTGDTNGPQCFQCKGSQCHKCNNFNPHSPFTRSSNQKRLNVVIDINGKKPKKAKNVTANIPKDDTLIVLQDQNSAFSVSKSSAKGKGDDTAGTSAAAVSMTNTDLIADLTENESSPNSTQDVVVFTNSISKSLAYAKASSTSASQQLEQTEQEMPTNASSSPAPAEAASTSQ